MKLASVKEFHDKVTSILRSKDVTVITRYGKIAGYFLPHRSKKIPPDVRWKLFDDATSRLKRDLQKQGISEEEIMEDFERWRKHHESSGRRR